MLDFLRGKEATIPIVTPNTPAEEWVSADFMAQATTLALALLFPQLDPTRPNFETSTDYFAYLLLVRALTRELYIRALDEHYS